MCLGKMHRITFMLYCLGLEIRSVNCAKYFRCPYDK